MYMCMYMCMEARNDAWNNNNAARCSWNTLPCCALLACMSVDDYMHMLFGRHLCTSRTNTSGALLSPHRAPRLHVHV